MKLATSTTTIHASGVLEQAQSKIQMNATAFRILSSGLYSDKIEAVLREIGCNAADAHIMAGKADVPFVVKLPTALDPEFAITDFGPGLSHEDVMELYQTYFASTKATSNDVTGCFGLGSKSPYAYTDQFTVQSVQNGVQRTYFCGKDEAGTPTTMLVDTRQAPDNWHSGLRVSLPVPPQDHTAFRDKAARIYRWFSTPPQIAGLTLRLPKVKQRLGSFIQYEDESKAVIIMGNVAYPLDFGAIYHQALDDSATATAVKHWYHNNLALIVPIGTVDITASRESVEYTDRTIKNLLQLVRDQAKDIVELVVQMIGDAPTDFEVLSAARKKIADGRVDQTIRAFRELIDQHTVSANKALMMGLDTVLIGRVALEGWRQELSWVDNPGTPDAASHGAWVSGYYAFTDDKGNKRLRPTPFGGSVALDGSELLVLDDSPKRARDRLRHYVLGNPDNRIFLLGHTAPCGATKWKEFLADLPVKVPYVLLSTLPVPPAKPKNMLGTKRVKIAPDNREVPVLDVAQADTYSDFNVDPYNPPTKCRLSDIPVEQRFYVRPWANFGRMRLSLNQHAHTDDTNPRSVVAAMKALADQQLPHISRVVVARGGEIERWKLHDFGFAPLSVWIKDELLAHPTIKQMNDLSQSSARPVEDLRLQLWASSNVAHALLLEIKKPTPLGQELAAALAGTQFLASMERIYADWEASHTAYAATAKLADTPLRTTLGGLGLRIAHPSYGAEDRRWTNQLEQLGNKYSVLGQLRIANGQIPAPSYSDWYKTYAKVVQVIINAQENGTT